MQFLDTEQADSLSPLRFFYGLATNDLRIHFTSADEMPSIARHLLVHNSDMTPRLGEFHRSHIGLRVQAKALVNPHYLVRAVVLIRSTDGQPVEFGAIGIHLESMSQACRELILEGKEPLGSILHQQKVVHHSQPSGYFRIEIDQRMAQLLGDFEGQICYGRCNVLRYADGSTLAEVVEILPNATTIPPE